MMPTVPPKHIMAQALKNSASGNVDLVDEIQRLQNEARIRSEINESKRQEARNAAERAAQISVREGIKTTKYPYVEPAKAPTPRGGRGGGGGGLPGTDERYAKGGSVRGGGCEQRGKTRGRMV